VASAAPIQQDLPTQTETIDSLAGRIKARYPDYANTDNRELVGRVIAKYPEYQTRLKTSEVQQLAAPGYKPEGFLSHAAETLGRQATGALESAAAKSIEPWRQAYRGYEAAKERGAGTLPAVGRGAWEAIAAAAPGYDEARGALQAAAENPQRRAAGYGPIYSALAPTAAAATM
jgi:hypothetical protein